jgi:hypothetical protein
LILIRTVLFVALHRVAEPQAPEVKFAVVTKSQSVPHDHESVDALPASEKEIALPLTFVHFVIASSARLF